MHCLPVTRPQDSVYAGAGTIKISGTKVTGNGTKFTEQVQVGALLEVKGVGKVKVKEIVSSTELVLDGDAPSTKDIPKDGATYKVSPKVDQTSMFEKVFQ